ncbi:hypothetical protein, partial [Tsukamurella hominis]|uniref:hypothetical protein n=1 Tax=Tsukamurella hominis TaxID=1970232 RepID=UPI0039EB9809
MPDRNPLRGLDWENIDEGAREAGQQVHEFIKNIRDGVIEWIKETTGIDLSGLAEFSDAIFEALAQGLNLSEGGAAVLELLEGLVTLDPRSFLDQLAGLFGGGSGLELPAIFTGLGEMFGGLRPDGAFDAAKLFGNLPAGIMAGIKGLLSMLGGNVELGQLIRLPLGQERNWLGTFDAPEDVPAGDGFEHDATVGRTRLGSAKLTFDGAGHVRVSEPIDVAGGQQLSLGGFVRFTSYAGSGGPAVGLRVLAYNAGDQLIGSQVIGTVTPSGATSSDFETKMETSWTAPAGTAYCYVRMEGYAAGTAGVAHFDDLWLRKPAQSLPQQWVEGLTGALSNLGQGVTDAWNFVQATIDNFMNGRGILGSLFSLGHFQDEVAKVFGPGSSIPQANVSGLTSALANVNSYVQDLVNAILRAIRGIPVVGGTLADIIAEVGGLNTKVVTAQQTAEQTAQGVVDGWIGSGASTGDVYDTMQAIRTSIAAGYTVQTITSNTTWTKPADLTELIVIGIGSGKTGAAGASGANGLPGGPGGDGGGFTALALDPSTISSTVPVVIGTSGGQTSFGSYLTTITAQGHIASELGFVPTTSVGGKGGTGGTGSDYNNPATQGGAGSSTPLAVGGTPNSLAGGTGGAGGAAPLNSVTKCAGAGGAGGTGGSQTAGSRAGGAGGPGGYP